MRTAPQPGRSERSLRWVAAALGKTRKLMIEGISARAQAIIGGPPSETNQRASTWSKK